MYISNFSSFIPSTLRETNQKEAQKDASIRILRNKHISKDEDKENTASSFPQKIDLKKWEREIASWLNKNRSLLDLPPKTIKNCGNKFTNLMKMAHLAAILEPHGLGGVDIPVPQGLPAEL